MENIFENVGNIQKRKEVSYEKAIFAIQSWCNNNDKNKV